MTQPRCEASGGYRLPHFLATALAALFPTFLPPGELEAGFQAAASLPAGLGEVTNTAHLFNPELVHLPTENLTYQDLLSSDRGWCPKSSGSFVVGMDVWHHNPFLSTSPWSLLLASWGSLGRSPHCEPEEESADHV